MNQHRMKNAYDHLCSEASLESLIHGGALGDRNAKGELLSRRLVFSDTSEPIRIPDLIEQLSKSPKFWKLSGRNVLVVERASLMVVDMFWNVP